MVSPVHPLWSWFMSTHLHYHPYIIPSHPFSSLLLILILPFFSFSFVLSSHTCPFFLDFSCHLILICPIKSSLVIPPCLFSSSHPDLSHFLILICLIFLSLVVYSSHLTLSYLLILICRFCSSLFVSYLILISPFISSWFVSSSHPYLFVLLILICLIFSSLFVRSSHPHLSLFLILLLSILLILICLIITSFSCLFVSSTSHLFFTYPCSKCICFMVYLVMFSSFLLLSTVLLLLVHPPLTPPAPIFLQLWGWWWWLLEGFIWNVLVWCRGRGGGGLYPKRNLKPRGLTLISMLLSWMLGGGGMICIEMEAEEGLPYRLPWEKLLSTAGCEGKTFEIERSQLQKSVESCWARSTQPLAFSLGVTTPAPTRSNDYSPHGCEGGGDVFTPP